MSSNEPMPTQDGTVILTDKTLKRLALAEAAVVPPAHFLLLQPEEGLSGNGQVLRIPLDLPSLLVGRIAPADLVLNSTMVSRRHCRFERDGEHMVLTDLGSTNGTFVGSQRVTW